MKYSTLSKKVHFLPKINFLRLLICYSAKNRASNDAKNAFVAICSKFHQYSTVLVGEFRNSYLSAIFHFRKGFICQKCISDGSNGIPVVPNEDELFTRYLLLLTFYSLLVTFYSLLVTRCFLLVTRYFLVFTCYFLLVTTYSLLLSRYFLLAIRRFLLFNCYFLFVNRYYLLVTLYFTFYLPLLARYLLLFTRYFCSLNSTIYLLNFGNWVMLRTLT